MMTSVPYLIKLNLPRWMKKSLVISSDLVICIFSVWLAFGLRTENWGISFGYELLFLITSFIVLILTFIFFGIYQAIFRYIGSETFFLLIRGFLVYFAIIFLVFSVIGIHGIPRALGILQPALLFICICLHRYLLHLLLKRIEPISQDSLRNKPNILIYGAGYAGRQLSAAIIKNPRMALKGFVDCNIELHGGTIDGVRVYSDKNLHELIGRLKITDVIFAIPSIDATIKRDIIELLAECHVRVRSMPNLLDVVSGKARVVDFNELKINDLLGRNEVAPDEMLLRQDIQGKVVVVTGSGGSIGSELCREIIKFNPKKLILIDINEFSLYLIYEELIGTFGVSKNIPNYNFKSTAKVHSIFIYPILASVRDKKSMGDIFRLHKPDVIFHAAAYKHVSLVEFNYIEGIRNNVYGTLNCAQISMEVGASKFVLVSTDKAVRPTSIMGASKRIAELVLQAHSEIANFQGYKTQFSMVRFGNVLGSSGSVIPLFESQIKMGGPITVTHKDITRYFMSISEAAQLVMQSCAMSRGGDVFVLDMGAPVRIYDLAVKMIYLSGFLLKDELHPRGDIEIEIIGLRDGEKLYEELLIGDNPSETYHPKIMKAHEEFLSWDDLQKELERLNLALDANDNKMIKEMLRKLVPGYQPNVDTVEWSDGAKT
jgi:FlaA1/EpsC-like NDP-sugar epimerase